jgi:hypothetical protein
MSPNLYITPTSPRAYATPWQDGRSSRLDRVSLLCTSPEAVSSTDAVRLSTEVEHKEAERDHRSSLISAEAVQRWRHPVESGKGQIRSVSPRLGQDVGQGIVGSEGEGGGHARRGVSKSSEGTGRFGSFRRLPPLRTVDLGSTKLYPPKRYHCGLYER